MPDRLSFSEEAAVTAGRSNPLGDPVSMGVVCRRGGGRSAVLSDPPGAARMAVKRRSLRLSSAGIVGGVSAARIASSDLVEENVLDTARPISPHNLWNPLASHFWPSVRKLKFLKQHQVLRLGNYLSAVMAETVEVS